MGLAIIENPKTEYIVKITRCQVVKTRRKEWEKMEEESGVYGWTPGTECSAREEHTLYEQRISDEAFDLRTVVAAINGLSK